MASVNVNDPNFANFVRECLDDEETVFSGDDSSDEEDNLQEESDVNDEIEGNSSAEEEDTSSSSDTIKGKNGRVWSLNPPKRTRTQARNIVRIPRTNASSSILLEHDALNLLIDQTIVETIVQFTNLEINIRRVKYVDQRFVNETDKMEIWALFGLLYLAGMKKDGHLSTEEMWSGSSEYKLVMSEMRFKFLLICLRFDDKQSRDRSDKFAPIKNLWLHFIKNCREQYIPRMYLTIDEQLLGFRGKCPFRVYISSKPDKYGIKIVTMCDANTFYMVDAIPYVGKEERNTTDSLPTYYVKRLSESVRGSNRNITCDNWFTSVPLAQELLTDYNLTPYFHSIITWGD